METIPEIVAAWRNQAEQASANAFHCDEMSRAQGKQRAYEREAITLERCADRLEAWWLAMSEGVTT